MTLFVPTQMRLSRTTAVCFLAATLLGMAAAPAASPNSSTPKVERPVCPARRYCAGAFDAMYDVPIIANYSTSAFPIKLKDVDLITQLKAGSARNSYRIQIQTRTCVRSKKPLDARVATWAHVMNVPSNGLRVGDHVALTPRSDARARSMRLVSSSELRTISCDE